MLDISLSGKTPIYEQLYSGIAGLISSGRMTAGEKLPPVREVAKQFGINPNTVQKSYLLLERAGLIYSVPAKGSYVSEKNDAARAIREQALRRLEAELSAALRAGVSRSDAEELVARIWRC